MQKIAIIGAGPAGVMTAITALQNNKNLNITIFDKSSPLKTILYTGGGRCNLSYAEYNFKELVKFYPRGEKFLLSIFARFGVKETLEFLNSLGIETYTQDDNRIFPVSNDANDVKEILLYKAKKLGAKFVNLEIQYIAKNTEKFHISNYKEQFDKVVIATGGNRLKPKFSGYNLAKSLDHSIVDLKPVLCGLKILETKYKSLSGLVLKDLNAKVFLNNKFIKKISGDLLFTHRGISGPLAYKISSYCAYCDFNQSDPITVKINLVDKSLEVFDKELVKKINQNPKKYLVKIIAEYIPKSLLEAILDSLKIPLNTKAGNINKQNRINLCKQLVDFSLNIVGRDSNGEIVTAGGIDLKEVNGKTMESKITKGLYFCGEVLDIDGLTGGFNLQACWSTGYAVGNNL